MVLIVFIQLEKRSSIALFRSDLFANRDFLLSSLGNACLLGFVWGIFFLLPLYLQNERGSPLKTGFTLPVALLSGTVSKLFEKWGAKPLLVTGFLLLCLSTLLRPFYVTSDAFWPLGLSCLLMGIELGVFYLSRALLLASQHSRNRFWNVHDTARNRGNLGLAIAGVLFRLGISHSLDPKMAWVESTFNNAAPDQVQSLVSNPAAAKALGSSALILSTLRDAFTAGFADAMWFLFAVALAGALFGCLLPKAQKDRLFCRNLQKSLDFPAT